jgi:hypothetical protein
MQPIIGLTCTRLEGLTHPSATCKWLNVYDSYAAYRRCVARTLTIKGDLAPQRGLIASATLTCNVNGLMSEIAWLRRDRLFLPASLHRERRGRGMHQRTRRIRASDGDRVRAFRRAAATTRTVAAAAGGLENQAGE